MPVLGIALQPLFFTLDDESNSRAHLRQVFSTLYSFYPLFSILFHVYRKESSFNLGSAETKLLYTLHWIVLDAADECILESENAGIKYEMGPFDYLFPLPAITVGAKKNYNP